MTADQLLIFLDPVGEPLGWLRLADGRVAARGESLADIALVDEDGMAFAVTGIVPGEAVTIHWLEVPGELAPAQAAAAARLLAAEVSAQPVGDLHVAVGRPEAGSDLRAVALVPALAMTNWLGRLQMLGFDPDRMIPDTLLLPVPDDGFVRFDGTSPPLFRGRGEAFAAPVRSVSPTPATLAAYCSAW